ncbi:Ig-like domain-containing protein [Alteromonas sp. a30]|uniref:Ig-like domain-containing protein n=1 Tax=Alteromonas sp. a30 TaxID=2730917 RepID=UPI00227DA127|nr:Ig-like domain-containing protein [Alteromonas sp. a30]MCY7297337.1 Ig-like domain-containing protein [Alteromonas sp. a30]
MNKQLVMCFALLGSMTLMSCGGGSSGANGEDPFNESETPVEALTLDVLNAQCNAVASNSFTTDDTICVRARLTRDGVAANNEVVSFTTNAQLGELSSATALTNTSGIAEISITNPETNIGAASLTATFNDLTESQGYEYLASPIDVVPAPQINITMLQDDTAVNRFTATESVLVQAHVQTIDNAPIANSIVNFSVSGGALSLSPSTALTSEAGLATIVLNSTDADQGAFTIQANVTVNGVSVSDAYNFEIQATDTVIDDGEIRIGYFDNDGTFIEGIVGSSIENAQGDVEISAGATVGFSVALVNSTGQRVLTPTPITFSSNCVASNQATLDEVVTTINGQASTTFEDINCAGSTGNSDQIIASATINGQTQTISRAFTIQPEAIGSISFISATPDEIVLQGTGGQNSASISTLTFQVNGELGNPLSQQEVDFSLNTTVGGLTLEPASGLTNSEGQVSTRVSAGSVPTSIRVTAEVNATSGVPIRTQSDLLSVNTGLPDQNSFSLSSNIRNPETFDEDGVEVVITARLADTFNNPVPNGTTVSFTTEGGSIQPSCITGADAAGNILPNQPNTGTCSVIWTSANPRPADHRVTILATAIGHETLVDSNGNNAYDDADGLPIIDFTDSGFGVSLPDRPGFVDHSEAWRDDNENGIRDDNEIFIDYNNDQSFNMPDGLFNGPQCQSSSLCGEGQAASLHVRKSLVLIMSSTDALYRIYNGDVRNINNVVFTNDPNVNATNSLSLNPGESTDLSILYYDSANQVLPAGTQLVLTDNQGNILRVLDQVNDSIRSDLSGLPGSFTELNNFTNDGTNPGGEQNAAYTIITPSGARHLVQFTITNN